MPQPISVVTWNLGWRFLNFEARQEPIARILAGTDADVMCLQEVWAKEGDGDQVAALGERLGLHAVRHDTASRDGLSFANGILSRWPVLESRNVSLPGADGKPSHRKVIHAVLESPRGDMHVLNTHLDHRFDNSALRAKQLQTICELTAGIERSAATDFPVVFAGDLNATPDSDEIRALTGRRAPYVPGLVFSDAWEIAGDESPGYTWRRDNPLLQLAQWPNRRLDYVLTSWPRTSGQGTPIGAQLIGTAEVDGTMASDHAGLHVLLR
jgi:endonuclease/exonuclease/phosphatase family metal-dependent hydrolase